VLLWVAGTLPFAARRYAPVPAMAAMTTASAALTAIRGPQVWLGGLA